MNCMTEYGSARLDGSLCRSEIRDMHGILRIHCTVSEV